MSVVNHYINELAHYDPEMNVVINYTQDDIWYAALEYDDSKQKKYEGTGRTLVDALLQVVAQAFPGQG